jgi:hypothetical protein
MLIIRQKCVRKPDSISVGSMAEKRFASIRRFICTIFHSPPPPPELLRKKWIGKYSSDLLILKQKCNDAFLSCCVYFYDVFFVKFLSCMVLIFLSCIQKLFPLLLCSSIHCVALFLDILCCFVPRHIVLLCSSTYCVVMLLHTLCCFVPRHIVLLSSSTYCVA